ncbi:MAG: mercury(II) reductase [Alphaproteobacteria bacterium]
MTDCCGSNGAGVDLIVVGAGSAGFSAAITAAERGARVALIGHGTIGGTCVNVGCVPSKTLIRAAETLHQGRVAGRFAGLSGSSRLDDWTELVAQKNDLVTSLRQAKYADLLKAYEAVSYVEGAARLTATGVVVEGRQIEADRTIVATGARAHTPSIPGLDSVDWLDSTRALDLSRLPSSLLVIGAGYIGCELAQLFQRAGVRVTLACRSRLLPQGEPEISTALAGYLRDEGMTVLDGVSYREVSALDAGVRLHYEQDGRSGSVTADRLLLATGRRPNSDGLGLSERGVNLDKDGAICIDERMRTTAAGVYAAGDVTGRDQFVYMAAYGARIAAENALNGNALVYDNRAMPSVTFTDPQVATVGLTEAEALARGIEAKISMLPLSAVPRALAARDTRGLIKLVADRHSDQLLGAHILAPEGADSIQTAALAIQQGLTTRALAGMIFPYLTTVEGLKLAAQTFDKDVAMLSCCAG